MNFKYTSFAALMAAVLSGCGTISALDNVVPDNTQEYRKAETMPPLDVPPDLSVIRINDDIAGSKKSSATYSEFQEEANNPLASKYNIKPDVKPSLDGEGEQRHLNVPSNKAVVWERLTEFSAEQGLTIARQDQRIGLMDTAAGADNYAYRFRVERGDTSKQSMIYIGAAAMDDNSQKNETMLRRLADYLGVIHQKEKAVLAQKTSAQPQVEAVEVVRLTEANGAEALLVKQDYPTVWKRVGRVLDSKGFAVEERNRSQGTYFVHYVDPAKAIAQEEEGLFSKLAFWKDDEDKAPDEYYNIKLISDAQDTKLVILDADSVRSSSDTAKHLLSLLQEQLIK